MGHDKKKFRTTWHLTFIKKKIVRPPPFKSLKPKNRIDPPHLEKSNQKNRSIPPLNSQKYISN